MASIIFDKAIDALHPFRITGFGPSVTTLLEAAQQELQRKVATESDGDSATWGFFPELDPDTSDYPACTALRTWFDKEFLSAPQLQSFELNLAFIRLATSEPQSSFGGLHIDASAGIDHLPPKQRNPQDNAILRVLINLYHEPRELQYTTTSIKKLRADRKSVV